MKLAKGEKTPIIFIPSLKKKSRCLGSCLNRVIAVREEDTNDDRFPSIFLGVMLDVLIAECLAKDRVIAISKYLRMYPSCRDQDTSRRRVTNRNLEKKIFCNSLPAFMIAIQLAKAQGDLFSV